MTDVFIPAAAGTYAVVISASPDDGVDANIDEVTCVSYPQIVAWRSLTGRDGAHCAQPVFADRYVKLDDEDVVWMRDEDGALRTPEGFWTAGDVTEARRVSLRFVSDRKAKRRARTA